jgi:hypothetical protein
MIGCFKPKDKEHHELKLPPTTNVNVCFHHLLNDHGTNIYAFDVDNTMYHQAFRSYMVTQEETESPLYHMVLELEAIELHRLSRVIEQAGGLVLDLSTDAVTCVCKSKELPFKTVTQDDKQMVQGNFYDDKKHVFKYKLEKKERLKVEHLPKFVRTQVYEHEEPTWKLIDDVNENNFDPLVDYIINSNQSVHIDGRAGTGKSTLIKKIQAELTKQSKKYITLCPTNKSARIVKGKTIHKFICESKGKINKSNDIDYVFVDEISMLSCHFYKYLITWKRANNNIKFIIAGDFQQLLPVKDIVDTNFDYKHSPALHELSDGNKLQLTNC